MLKSAPVNLILTITPFLIMYNEKDVACGEEPNSQLK